MSLQTTHIRFALENNLCQEQTLHEYLSGAIYPDSRYITRVNRDLTHCNITNITIDSDFSRGWYVHCLCDVKFNVVKRKVMGPLFSENNDHVLSTAIKQVQDMNDFNQIRPYLHYFNMQNPNNEKMNDLHRYQKIIIHLYNRDKITLDDYCQMWSAFGVKREMIIAIKEKSEELLNSPSVLNHIEELYINMIK